ncbi:sensor domain-containing diguanylate cyclase [Roseibium marinum]|uniref:PAS domain S-box-containing protein/diguanylate cyclase (GGDEF)-like protein n=1 Tax=Roseibium marinum TaxID=281252 RepID=A0A2S3UVZ2_9HYPH|nr:diguanylate cyclase [Roseibium marinum]POF31723.1 PAS domain S-box-containing protein/diguanylate cyclase (GGDEF)-like protein [Roseibium marinum]
MALDSSKDIPSGREPLRPSGIDFESLVRLSNEAVILLDLRGTPLFISPAAERLFGWRAEKLAGHLGSLVQVSGSNANAELLQRILSGNGDTARPLPHADLQFSSAFGPVIWAEVRTHLLENAAGAPYAFAVYLRDIAKRKELESQLEAATQTDPVTGLFNRRAFEDNLKREWAIALREKTHTSLIRVSLDRFDALAEHNGPAAAEDCLTRVAETLKDIARRPADITARTATSEFSILLPRTHEQGAETIGAYIHLAIRDLGIPNPDNGRGAGVVTASVGAACAVAEQTGVSESPEFILAAAENCVFQARQEGGNRIKTVMNVLAR